MMSKLMDIAIIAVQNLKEENKRLKEENEKLLLIIENLSSNGKSGKHNNQRNNLHSSGRADD